MSTEAVAWALDRSRSGPMSAEARLVLIALAEHARREHDHQTWVSAGSIAAYIGVTKRSVRRNIAALLEAGVIAPGDQDLTAHLPANRRSTVYALDVTTRRSDTSVIPRRSRSVPSVTPDPSVRGDATDQSGVTRASPKPKEEPTTTPYPQRPPAAAAALPATEQPPEPELVCHVCGAVDDHDPATCPAASSRRPPALGCPVHPGRPHPACRGCGTNPRSRIAYAAAVDAAQARRRARRPDGTCRQCDDRHPLGTPCPPLTPPPLDWRTAPPPEDALPLDQLLPDPSEAP